MVSLGPLAKRLELDLQNTLKRVDYEYSTTN